MPLIDFVQSIRPSFPHRQVFFADAGSDGLHSVEPWKKSRNSNWQELLSKSIEAVKWNSTTAPWLFQLAVPEKSGPAIGSGCFVLASHTHRIGNLCSRQLPPKMFHNPLASSLENVKLTGIILRHSWF